MQIRAAKVDGTPLDKPLGTVNITVNYSIRKKIPEEFETQVKRIYPGATESKVLWSRSVQIPESGIIMISARFPIAAVSGYINVNSCLYISLGVIFILKNNKNNKEINS